MAKAYPKHRKPQPFTNLVGETFGRWLVIEHRGVRSRSNKPRSQERFYFCRCTCGTEKEVSAASLRCGHSSACRRCGNQQHGGARHTQPRAPEYNIWLGMLNRCHYSTNSHMRKNYADRGIVVCQRWRESYAAFLEDMGPRITPQHTIDRTDNNGNYSCGRCPECLANNWPANCRWATRAEQSRNMRTSQVFTHDGLTLNVTQWGRHVGLTSHTIRYRMAQGMSFAEAISTPRRGGRRPTIKPLSI